MKTLMLFVLIAVGPLYADNQEVNLEAQTADVKNQIQALLVQNAKLYIDNKFEMKRYDTFQKKNVSLEVNPKKSKRSTKNEHITSWGSYDNNTSSQKVMLVEIKSIKEIPYSAIEFFWNIRSEANKASYLKRCVPEMMLGGKTSAEFSISTQSSDLNLKLIGVREKDGEKVLGWMARCVDLSDGQVLGVRASSTDLEKLGKAGTRIGSEVE
jgi:hypothetical protein